jgi:hypothetical protein
MRSGQAQVIPQREQAVDERSGMSVSGMVACFSLAHLN